MSLKWDRTKGKPEPVASLDRVKLTESGEPLVSLVEFCPKVRLARPQVIPYLRENVAKMLAEASESLPPGIFLAVIDAWRPFARQVRIFEYMWNCAKEAYPERNEASLRRTVNRWVAPVNRPSPPGHCTGAAVDVWLVDANDEILDVTSPYGRFQSSPTYSFGLTEQAQANRTLLIESMLSVGFSNCRDEWWHYSWGDAGWAVRMGLEECHYGLAEIAPELYAEQERLSELAFRDRSNPFLEGR